jgi:NAD(P)-dependent dehydrogenase (short-subunit alcohol dehydrogenase family)
MSAGKAVWFVTGSSRGLGRAIVETVLARGYRCVMAARDPGAVAALAAKHPSTALAVALDVADAAARERSLARAYEAFGGIDVLVNNAGIGYNAAVEEGEDEVIRRVFETNFFGLAALIRAVLPAMRARGSGHIMNISSSGGVTGTMGGGYYSATKFALEGLSEALVQEVAPLGLRVTVVEPGPFRTEFQGASSMTVPRKPIAAYAGTAGERREYLRELHGRQAGDPVRAAEAIVAAYESKAPPLHLALGATGFERIRDKLVRHLQELDTYRDVALGADYPPGKP